MALCCFDGIQGGVLQRLGVRYVKVLRSWNMASGSSGLGFWLCYSINRLCVFGEGLKHLSLNFLVCKTEIIPYT